MVEFYYAVAAKTEIDEVRTGDMRLCVEYRFWRNIKHCQNQVPPLVIRVEFESMNGIPSFLSILTPLSWERTNERAYVVRKYSKEYIQREAAILMLENLRDKSDVLQEQGWTIFYEGEGAIEE